MAEISIEPHWLHVQLANTCMYVQYVHTHEYTYHKSMGNDGLISIIINIITTVILQFAFKHAHVHTHTHVVYYTTIIIICDKIIIIIIKFATYSKLNHGSSGAFILSLIGKYKWVFVHHVHSCDSYRHSVQFSELPCTIFMKCRKEIVFGV